jgi:acetate kinase
VPAAQLAHALEHESGLLALGGSADMREITSRAERGDERAGLAFDVYTGRLLAGIAAMTAALGGLDALVFTGGVGQRSAHVRASAASGLAFLGVVVDEALNHARDQTDRDVSAPDASVRTLVLAAREDLEIARQTRDVIARGAA